MPIVELSHGLAGFAECWSITPTERFELVPSAVLAGHTPGTLPLRGPWLLSDATAMRFTFFTKFSLSPCASKSVCVCVFFHTSWGKHLPAVDREVSDDLEGRGDIGGFRFVGSMERSREQTKTKFERRFFIFLRL